MRPRLAVVQLLAFSALALAALLAPVSRGEELPPEVQVDRLLVQAEREIKDGEHWSAVLTFERILAVCEEHRLEIPAEFWFRHAGVLHSAGLHERAIEASTRYLKEAGRGGKHYQAALQLLDAAEVGMAEARREQARARVAQEREERVAAAERAAREELAAQAGVQRESSAELPRDAMKDGGAAPLMIRLPAGRICFGKETCRMVDVPPFAISKHAVTVEQFRHFARSTRYRTGNERRRRACWEPGGNFNTTDAEMREHRKRTWKTVSETQTGWHPVVCVSMEDANRYARWLSEQTGRRYRLPGQAEWDYAFLGGTTIGQVENTHPDRYWELFQGGDHEKPAFWRCAEGDSEDNAVTIGPVGSCPLSPMGIWFEPGDFSEMLHTCNMYSNGMSADGTYEPLDGCRSVQTRSYFNRTKSNPLSLSAGSPTYAHIGFRVVKEL